MDDEDKQYDDAAEKEDELGAHGFHTEGEDEDTVEEAPAGDGDTEDERF